MQRSRPAISALSLLDLDSKNSAFRLPAAADHRPASHSIVSEPRGCRRISRFCCCLPAWNRPALSQRPRLPQPQPLCRTTSLRLLRRTARRRRIPKPSMPPKERLMTLCSFEQRNGVRFLIYGSFLTLTVPTSSENTLKNNCRQNSSANPYERSKQLVF